MSSVSVIMSVYNGSPYLAEAIESILKQTYSDFEFIIIDDASTDKTKDIIKSYKDKRIIYRKNEFRKGLATSLNAGIKLANGIYIARMDADDISLPTRLESQVNLLNNNPNIGVCGSFIEVFDSNGLKYLNKYPITNEEIKIALLYNCPLAHPSTVIRKCILHEVMYDVNYTTTQDYKLWVDLMETTQFYNIPKVLLHYRKHNNAASYVEKETQKKNRLLVIKSVLGKLNITPTQKDLILHEIVFTPWMDINNNHPNSLTNWMVRILQNNKKIGIFHQNLLQQYFGERWFQICYDNTNLGFNIFLKYFKNDLSNHHKLRFITKLKFLLKALFFIPHNSNFINNLR